MKTLLIAILLLTSSLFAQKYYEVGSGFFINDSLYQDYPDLTAESPIDSTNTYDIINLGFGFEWLTITAIDTGTTYTDSIVVEYSMPGFAQSLTSRNLTYNQVDSTTIWQPVQFMRDSSWTAIVGGAIPIDNNSIHSYRVFVGSYDKIRVRMTNAALVAGRVWKYRISAVKKVQ
jgi:hypothetical protein